MVVWKNSIIPQNRDFYGKGVTPPKSAPGKRERKAKAQEPSLCTETLESSELFCKNQYLEQCVNTAEDELLYSIQRIEAVDIPVKVEKKTIPRIKNPHKIKNLVNPQKETTSLYKLCSDTAEEDININGTETKHVVKASPSVAKLYFDCEDLETGEEGNKHISHSKLGGWKLSSGGAVYGTKTTYQEQKVCKKPSPKEIRIKERTVSSVKREIGRLRNASKTKWLVSELRIKAETQAQKSIYDEYRARHEISSEVPEKVELLSWKNYDDAEFEKYNKNKNVNSLKQNDNLPRKIKQRNPTDEIYLRYLKSLQ